MKKITHHQAKHLLSIKHVVLIFIGFICFFGALFYLNLQLVNIRGIGLDESGLCSVQKVSLTVRGNSMSPRIEDSSIIEVEENYYECRGKSPKHGDVIIVEDSAIEGPYIKTIGAIPGDAVKLTENGNLLVNGIPLRNQSGEVYFFTSSEQNFLSLYIRDGRLQNNAYFVFGENTKNSRDSRKIGALAKSAIRAKVISVNNIALE